VPVARRQPLPLRPDAARQQRGHVRGAIDQGQLEEQPAADQAQRGLKAHLHQG
jgi:hypothetical protein